MRDLKGVDPDWRGGRECSQNTAYEENTLFSIKGGLSSADGSCWGTDYRRHCDGQKEANITAALPSAGDRFFHGDTFLVSMIETNFTQNELLTYIQFNIF